MRKALSVVILLTVLLCSPLSAKWNPAGIPLNCWGSSNIEVVPGLDGDAWICYTTLLETGPATVVQHLDSDGDFLIDGNGLPLPETSALSFRPLAAVEDGHGGLTLFYTQATADGYTGVWYYGWRVDQTPLIESPAQLYRDVIIPSSTPSEFQTVKRSADGCWILFHAASGDLLLSGVDAGGEPFQDSPIRISTMKEISSVAAITSDHDDGVWVAWHPGEGTRLYYQQIDHNGDQVFDDPRRMGAYEYQGGRLKLFPGITSGFWASYSKNENMNIYCIIGNGVLYGSVPVSPLFYDVRSFDGFQATGRLSINLFMLYYLSFVDSKRVIAYNFTMNGNGSSGSSSGVFPWNSHQYDALQVLRDPETDWKTMFYLTWTSSEEDTSLTLHTTWMDRHNVILPFEREAPIHCTMSQPSIPDRWAWRLSDGSSLVAVPFGEENGVYDLHLYHFESLNEMGEQIALSLPDRCQPFQFSVNSAYPNPFNNTTRLTYTLPFASHVVASVYDVVGRRVAILEDGEQSAGRHLLTWSSKMPLAGDLASGVYFLQLETEVGAQTQKLILLK